MATEKIPKNYSNILMKQQLLHLICFHYLMCSILFLPYTWKIYFLLFCCYLSYHYHYHFHHLFHLQNNSKLFDVIKWLSLYSNKLCIGKTISRSFALSANVLLDPWPRPDIHKFSQEWLISFFWNLAWC